MSGYSAASFRAWQETARCFGDCSEETSGTGVMFENHSQDTRYTGPLEVAQTVFTEMPTHRSSATAEVMLSAYIH